MSFNITTAHDALTVVYRDIDWTLLREQKQWLVNQSGHHAAGLLGLLDSIQDTAIRLGVVTESEVFDLDQEYVD